ncbi:hypothetical protein [Thalassotalea sp. G2M2-11]|uniref:hypothetical protein n=1 Tax=Thalassotalea sp. G2M2-11 TaxID=2787627 RepID=UPI0019D14EE2|nr:hypothetical protein [Thalassotalea sp. G2M2-11]
MPLPLLWIGAAAVSALAAKSLSDDRKTQQQKRRRFYRAQTLTDLQRHESPVAIYPSDFMSTEQKVKPKVGAVVCCGIGGVLEHTGIWVDDNTIVELDGNGMIKPISVQRFTKERSGKYVFIACDSHGIPLACEEAATRALAQIFQVRDYHLIEYNCHQFIWQCFEADAKAITTFKALNMNLAARFNRRIYWDLCDC